MPSGNSTDLQDAAFIQKCIDCANQISYRRANSPGAIRNSFRNPEKFRGISTRLVSFTPSNLPQLRAFLYCFVFFMQLYRRLHKRG